MILVTLILSLTFLALFGTVAYGMAQCGMDVAELPHATQLHKLGTRVMAEDGTQYCYVKATAAIAQYDAVMVDYTDTTNLPNGVKKTSGATSVMIGVAPQAFTTTLCYGWIIVSGLVTANVATSVAAGDRLIPTSTAGRLGTYANTDVVNIGAVGASAEASNRALVLVQGLF